MQKWPIKKVGGNKAVECAVHQICEGKIILSFFYWKRLVAHALLYLFEDVSRVICRRNNGVFLPEKMEKTFFGITSH